MDLNELLKKTKDKKSAKIRVSRPHVRIATEERPYDGEADTKKADDFVQSAPILKLEALEPPIVHIEIQEADSLNNLKKATIEESVNIELSHEPIEPTPDRILMKRKDASNFSSLSGLERELVLYLHDLCVSNRSTQTPPVSNSYLSPIFNRSSDTIKTTLRRIQAKGLIKRLEYLSGKGGFTVYEISEETHQEITTYGKHQKLLHNAQKTFGNNSETIRKQESKNEPIQNEWDEIDISPLFSIHFGKAHIEQLKNGPLSPEMVQDSIKYFAYMLQHSQSKESKIGKPLNYLMSILKRGIPVARPDGYQSPEEKAQAEYLEALKKTRLEKEARENEICELMFMEWLESLSQEEKKTIIPMGMKPGSNTVNLFLKSYYRDNLWPEQRIQSLKQNSD
jgi:hypothetical protein